MATNFSSVSCAEGFLIPHGYRFRPTNKDVLFYYLLPAIHHHQLPCNIIRPLEIYGKDKEPWKLFDEKAEEPFWVFTKLKKKSQLRKDRVAGCGSWIGQYTVPIKDDAGKVIGENKYFTFKCNDKTSTPRGRWMMHEYSHIEYDEVICKIQYKDVKNKRRRRNSSDSDSDLEALAKRVCSDQRRSNGGTFETDPEGLTCTNGYISQQSTCWPDQQGIGNGNINGANLIPTQQPQIPNTFVNSTAFSFQAHSSTQNSYIMSTHSASSFQQVPPEQACEFVPYSNMHSHQNICSDHQGNGNGGNLIPTPNQQTHQPHIANTFANFTSFTFQSHPSPQNPFINTHSVSSFRQVPPEQTCYGVPNSNIYSHQSICPDQQGNGTNGDGNGNGGNLIPLLYQQTHQTQIPNWFPNSYNLESNAYESNAVALTKQQPWTDEEWNDMFTE